MLGAYFLLFPRANVKVLMFPFGLVFVPALIVLGLALFALPRVRYGSVIEAAGWCAVFGVICYSVYDLTNYSTMQGFPLKVVAIDMIWGGVVCGAAGAAMHAFGRPS